MPSIGDSGFHDDGADRQPRRRRSNAFHCDGDENELTKAVWSEKAHFNPYAKAARSARGEEEHSQRLELLLKMKGLTLAANGSPLSQI